MDDKIREALISFTEWFNAKHVFSDGVYEEDVNDYLHSKEYASHKESVSELLQNFGEELTKGQWSEEIIKEKADEFIKKRNN